MKRNSEWAFVRMHQRVIGELNSDLPLLGDRIIDTYLKEKGLEYKGLGRGVNNGLTYAKTDKGLYYVEDLFEGTEEEFDQIVPGEPLEVETIQKIPFVPNSGKKSDMYGQIQEQEISQSALIKKLRATINKEWKKQESVFQKWKPNFNPLKDDIIEAVVGIMFLGDSDWNEIPMIGNVRVQLDDDSLTQYFMPEWKLKDSYIEVTLHQGIVVYLYFDGKMLQPYVPMRGNWIYNKDNFHGINHLFLDEGILTVEEINHKKSGLDKVGAARFEDDTMPIPIYEECWKEFKGAFSGETLEEIGRYVDPHSLLGTDPEVLTKLLMTLEPFREIYPVKKLLGEINSVLSYKPRYFMFQGENITKVYKVTSISPTVEYSVATVTKSMCGLNGSVTEGNGELVLDQDGNIIDPNIDILDTFEEVEEKSWKDINMTIEISQRNGQGLL